ncbi:stage II sporulation protein D [Paenibacillus sp. tmac-D7]|uniref:stage II sporulation protein D n=1 Tax=Paenibacillus sp. tmac-D7 TaxID=2591462 RepID=UPI001141724E|nr:stage II sporulation protein D [Paenibacillus sp. tmac-D7]
MMKYKLSRTQSKWARWFALWLAGFLSVIVIVPWLFVHTPGVKHESSQAVRHEGSPPSAEEAASMRIPVYVSSKQMTDRIALETYVLGVVAAEMPVEFELEALKAQAMAARTYIVRRVLSGDRIEVPGSEAVVTDTTAHQAYVNDEELRRRWEPELYATNMAKLRRSVEETKDIVLTYEGQPIDASFFSTSNGYTENSEDYWNLKLPYLRSVASPWDAQLSPRYKETVTFTARELQRKLGLPAAVPVTAGAKTGLKVMERSAGHRIKRLTVGGKSFTGREFREKLGLNSSQFQWSYANGTWTFVTFGYGHGVGMSQWGANGMAREGRKAEEIVKYFYTGIDFGKASTLLKGKSL